MTHHDAKNLLAPLATDDRAASTGDVAAWVMRDVRAIAGSRRAVPDDAAIWRWAAGLAGMAAVVAVVATLQLVAVEENPLVEFASVASLEAR